MVLILLHMHMSKTASYAQIGHVWLALEPHLRQSSMGHSGCRDAVKDVNKCSKKFSPELSRAKTSLMKYVSQFLQ